MFLSEAKKSYLDNVKEHEDFFYSGGNEEPCHGKKLLWSCLSHAIFPKANQVSVPVRSVAPYNKT